MKSTTIFLCSLISILFLASCEKEIDFTGKITESQVVVNSFITPDSVIKAHVSESKFFLANGSVNDIKNADISVFVNGIFKEKMMHSATGNYVANYKPLVSDIVRLEVKVPAKPLVSAQTVIEPSIQLFNLDTTKLFTSKYPIVFYNKISLKQDTIGYNQTFDCHFKLKFKDVGTKNNFYRLSVRTRTLSLDSTEFVNYFFVFDDIVSGNTSNSTVGPPTSLSSNIYNVFTDELFNGKDYSLSFHISNSTAKLFPEYEYLHTEFENYGKMEVSVNLQSISKSYYLYLKSREASSTSNAVFSEPIQIHNNIVGGIGILGSYTSNVFDTIEL